MTTKQSEDLAGIRQTTEQRTQHPRAPLSALELSLTDAIRDHFEKRAAEPSYEDIHKMVPPYKYVNANFKVYPLILGEKEGNRKIRMLSDGSELHLGIMRPERPCGIDAPAHWYGPALKLQFAFGSEARTFCSAPRWHKGYLPIARFSASRGGIRYEFEIFGALLPYTTKCLCAWARLGMKRLKEGGAGQWTCTFRGDTPLSCDDRVLHEDDKAVLRGALSHGWAFDSSSQSATAILSPEVEKQDLYILIANETVNTALLEWPAVSAWNLDQEQSRRQSEEWLREWTEAEMWERRRREVCGNWDKVLRAARVRVPERVVNNAHKATRITTYVIANGNQMNYSVHDAYERLYTGEASQAALGLGYWGHQADAARYLGHIAFYMQKSILRQCLGTQLIPFCRHIDLFDDRDFLQRNIRRMELWAEEILSSLSEKHKGLMPRQNYCGDLHQQVYALQANAVAWRGVHDFAVLTNNEEMLKRAAEFRSAILAAVEASMDRSADPSFVPMSLYGEDPTPEKLTGTTLGSYWCLVAPRVLGSNVLGDDHPAQQSILDTLDRRGGLCGGLLRWTPHPDYNTSTTLLECGLDDLYGLPLCEMLARRDEPDRLVLTLYSKLAIGLTENTFMGGEVSSLVPSHIHDPECTDGRGIFQPPNSASAMFYATLLRHCLIFDFDSDGTGRPDTLRLAFSTPRRWLKDGKNITVRAMPTSFGPVSFTIRSNLARGMVEATVTVPKRRQPKHLFLRLRLPEDKTSRKSPRIVSVTVNGQPHHAFDAATGTIDLSGMQGKLFVEATCRKGR